MPDLSQFVDRLTAPFAPAWTLRRSRARVALALLQRHYEAAAVGRRTQGWSRFSGDANAAIAPTLARLRDLARDLVRNNAYAESAVGTIGDDAVGEGIVAKPATAHKAAADLWKAWAGTTACDADGLHDFAGLQKLVMTTVVGDGEVLVRRRMRRVEDGWPIPMQLQVLEPDYLDTLKDASLPGGGEIVNGVEFNGFGQRVAYWLYPKHPGAIRGVVGTSSILSGSRRVPATEILHIFKVKRAGQVRGVTWFAPVILRFRDFDEFEDATLMKQKIAACLAVITSDVDGTGSALGAAGTATKTDGTTQEIDLLSPGAILNLPPGRNVQVVQPPQVREYADYCEVNLRSIATGLGVTYEDLTGDYTDLPFSAARMSRLRHGKRVVDWRWRMLVPRFCDPVWRWAMDAAAINGLADAPAARWTAPPMPMIEPDKEGLALQRLIRTGVMTLSEAIRERGYDPEELLDEMAADNARLDKLGLSLDSDPRRMTQAGQRQGDEGDEITPPSNEDGGEVEDE
jgi:lambda family phage portal protein